MDSQHTRNDETELASESLGGKIELIIRSLPPERVTVAEIMEIVGQDSLILLAIILSLVFLVPVSIPGVSTVFGGGILLISITRLLNLKPWLPKSIAHRRLSSEQLRKGFMRALVWFRRLEKISRPYRLPYLTSAKWIIPLNNFSLVLAALLLMLPFGLIPLSNTLPALALIALSVGMLQKDGCFILLGYLANAVTIIYFTALIAVSGLSLYKLLGN